MQNATATMPDRYPDVAASGDFISLLLQEQQCLTAVERFSNYHSNSSSVLTRHTSYRQLLPASPPRDGFQFAFEVDLDQCSGCKACVVACHTMNGLDDSEAWRRVGTVTSPEPFERIQHVTTACHHCEEPACLLGCPVKAYEKNPVTGIVRHLDDQCIGCKYCTMMCPYEVPQFSERLGIVRKCDMCHQRLSVGEAPACVQGCPNQAIAIREVPVSTSIETTVPVDTVRLAAGAPDSSITRPTTRYLTTKPEAFRRSRPQDERLDVASESHWPLALMLVGTQASVGLLFVERCVALLMNWSQADQPLQATRVAGLVAFTLASAGLGIAPLHLGQPLRSWRIFLGLRTSWLSREAVILGQFVSLLAVTVLLLWKPVYVDYLPEFVRETLNHIPVWIPNALLGSALVLGAVGLYCSAMIYVVTRRHLWRHRRTFSKFFSSALIGGAGCMLPIIAIYSERPAPLLLVGGITLFAVSLKLVLEGRLVFGKALDCQYDQRSQRLMVEDRWLCTAYHFATGVFAIALIGVAMATSIAGYATATVVIALAAALALLTAELLERLSYFMTVVYDRMPGTMR